MTIRPDRRRHPATRAGRVAPLIFAALGGGCTTLPMPPRLSHTASSARVDPAPGSVARRTSSGASAVHPTTRVQVVPSFGAYAPRQLPGHEPGPRPSTIASAPAPGPAPRPVPSSGPSVPMPTSLTTSTLPGGFSLPDAPAPGSGPDRDPEVSTTSPAGRGLIAPSPDPTEERLPEEAGAGREEPTAGDADRRAEPTIEAVPQVPEVIIPPGVVPVPVPSDPVPVPESPAILPEDLPSTPATPMAQEPERAPADSVPPAASDVANSDHAAGGDWGPLGGARPQAPSRRDDGPLDPPPPPAPSANSTPPVADGPDLAEPGPGPDVPPAVTPSVGPDAAPAPAEEMPPALDGQPPIDLPAAAPAPTGDAPNPGDDPHAEVPAPAPTGDVPNLGDLPLPEVPAPPGDADANPPGDLPPPSAPAPDEALEPAIPPPTSPEPGPPAPPVPGDVPAPARDGAAPPAEVPAPAEAAPLPGDAPAPVAPEPVEAPESLLDQLPGIPPLPLEEDKTASAAVARFRPAPARVVLERVFGQPLGGLRGPDLRPRPPATPEARAALAAMRRRLDDSRRPGPEQVAARILR